MGNYSHLENVMAALKFWFIKVVTHVTCFFENFVPQSIAYYDDKKEVFVEKKLDLFQRYIYPWKYILPKDSLNTHIHYKFDNKKYTYVHKDREPFVWPPCQIVETISKTHVSIVMAIKVSQDRAFTDVTSELLSMMGPHLDFYGKKYLTRDLFPDAKFICVRTFRDVPIIFDANQEVVRRFLTD
jgi:hypothetical protein